MPPMVAAARVAVAPLPAQRDGTVADPRVRVVRSLQQLECVFEPDVALAVWRRDEPLLEQAAAQARAGSDRKLATLEAAHCSVAAIADALRLDARSPLAADIAHLGELFATIAGCRRIGVRLESMSRPTCPKHHIDRVPMRLVCAYAGGGTEWLDAQGDCHALRDLDVALFKGSTCVDLQVAPLLHRSPDVAAGTQRLLLTIDML